MIRRYSILGLMAAGALPALFLVACGGGGGSTTARTTAAATINLSLSDPAPCGAASSGPYKSIFITISDVQINASASAGDNDPNWLDLTPSLKSSGIPQQVDLLALPNPQCFLATLGSTTSIPPGTYQQIRIFLADNTAANATLLGNNNRCGAAAVNCVILAPPNPATPQTLQLSSEVRTGIKVPSGQIAGGQFTIAAGETKDLDIDIDSCASIVVAQGNGQFRLKPVLHAGEVSLTSSSINGKLVDANNNAIAGIKAIVALEKKDSGGVDRVVMQTTTDSAGNFNFCPVPAGTYDVVAVIVSSTSNTAFAATVTTGAAPGNALGNVTMNAVTGASTAPAILNGDVSTANSSTGGVVADITLAALQQATIGSATSFTVPAGAQSTTLNVTTTKPASCTSTSCPTFTATYSMSVPPVNPTTGAFTAGTATHYTAGATGNANYIIEGNAFVPGSAGQSDCNPSRVPSATVSVGPGSTTSIPTLAFIGCQ